MVNGFGEVSVVCLYFLSFSTVIIFDYGWIVSLASSRLAVEISQIF